MSVDIVTETMIERAVDDVASLQDGLELSATLHSTRTPGRC
jgi:hypothetical protein